MLSVRTLHAHMARCGIPKETVFASARLCQIIGHLRDVLTWSGTGGVGCIMQTSQMITGNIASASAS